jgi:carboxypeptidase Taq
MSDTQNREPPANGAYQALTSHMREAALFATAANALAWDQETMMPRRGASLRASQLAALSGLVHERHVSPEMGEWLARCESDRALLADERIAANLRQIRRDYDRSVRVPNELVREFTETTALAQQAWRDARERSDFPAFAPWLEKIVDLSRRRAECLRSNPDDKLYDVLMDGFEPGARMDDIAAVFSELRSELTPLIAEIAGAAQRPNRVAQHGDIPIEAQAAFNSRVAAAVGFDFDAGRLDVSTHPFCEGIGPGDTRLTTRYRTDLFADSLSSTLHEVGHGLYEQGLPKADYLGQPLGTAASLGIHESQSRMWENMVGRSRAFWDWATPRAREAFGPPLEQLSPDQLYEAVNVVEPNLIRVDSDEATYNLHIMLRFDLERALLEGDLAIRDLPGEWNERIRTDLGMEVPDDRRGCLQDIHWALGAIGYFPTYTLGNLYAAQLWESIVEAMPALDDQMRHGEFSGLLGWLRENVHRFGQQYSAAELCERATGSAVGAEPFIRYLSGKLRPLYGI